MRRMSSLSVLFLITLVRAAVFADTKLDFGTQIQPIFTEHCAKCHGPTKSAAKLRLDSADVIKQKLATDAELVVVGDPIKSELYRRLALPAADEEHMPKGSDPLPKELVDRIGAWIKQGAELSSSSPSAVVATAAPADSVAPARSVDKRPQLPTLPTVNPAAPAALDKLTAAGAQIMPLFGGSSLLQVSFAHRGAPPGDADLGMLKDIADQVYTLDLAGCQATADGFAALAALKNLSSLHLERSTVTDDALGDLSGLAGLSYLNLYGADVSDAGIAKLGGLTHLAKLYLWQTKVSPTAAIALEGKIPGLSVDLGYDNPEMNRHRLEQAIEQVKQQSDAAKAAVAEESQRLEAAKQRSQELEQRRAVLENQIQALQKATGPEHAAASSADQASQSK
jgi:hypothetical protein